VGELGLEAAPLLQELVAEAVIGLGLGLLYLREQVEVVVQPLGPGPGLAEEC